MSAFLLKFRAHYFRQANSPYRSGDFLFVVAAITFSSISTPGLFMSNAIPFPKRYLSHALSVS
ncbi:hypothetical protein, partial [Undibacterium sp. SXout20W]|uniref:hypothetical protein n=1 Tax=Undibacterium sp. SXout20W TaxID=3413051 RepID=UPI003BF3D346